MQRLKVSNINDSIDVLIYFGTSILFYVKNTMEGKPMYIDNLDEQMSFINSVEAGKFMAHLVDKDFLGAINGCSYGTISIREILDYVEKKTSKKAILSDVGEIAPYNGTLTHSINIDKSAELKFEFSDLKNWMYDLLDTYIENVR